MIKYKIQVEPFSKREKFLFYGVILAIMAIVIIVGVSKDSDLTPVAEPLSGQILSGREAYNGSEITITASRGASCVVKLKTQSGVERLSFYVRAGDTVTVGIPAEYLQVYFATGSTWYGDKHLFGSNTNYSKDKEIIDFTRYTVTYTLNPSGGGNFSQTHIDEDEF